MKREVFLSSLVSLTIIGASLIAPSKSGAEPAPVFKPLISEIRSRLPGELAMRLPSSLPSLPRNVKLYPYIVSNSKVFGINLGLTPDCSSSNDPSYCTAGGFSVFTEAGSKVWPPKGDTVTSVDLGNDIRGFYVTRGEGRETSRYVFWEQDGLKYSVGIGSGTNGDVSQQQLMDMATSMVNEPAIINAH